MTIWDLFVAEAIGLYFTLKDKGNEPLLFEKNFPAKKKVGLMLSWFKGHNNLPIDIQPSAFDAAIPIRNRQDFSKVMTEMPLFREEMPIYEMDRQEMLALGDMEGLSGRDKAIVKELIDRLFDDRYQLYRGAKSLQEFMRASLVTTGKISIAARNDVGTLATYDYNFDPNDTWKGHNFKTITTSTKFWEDETNSDPLGDMEDMIEYASEDGVIIEQIIMGAVAYKHLLNNARIKRDMNGNNVANMVGYSKPSILAYIENYLGVKIVVDRQKHKDTTGTTQFYYPQNGCVTFLGASVLGNTWFGTTPEEADANSVPGCDASIVDTGICIMTQKKIDPNVTKITRVSELCLPSFENMDAVYNLKWGTTPTPTLYTVTYDGNGNTTGTAPAAQTQASEGAPITLADGTGLATATGSFDHWNTEDDDSGTSYNAGQEFTPTEDTTLYAIYV